METEEKLKSESDGGCGERAIHFSLRVRPSAAAHTPAEDRTFVCIRAALTGQRAGTEQELEMGVLEGRAGGRSGKRI